MRVAPSAALNLVREFEGCHLAPYHDPVGFPTIGWGRLLSREKWADLSQWTPISQDEADAMLVQNLERHARAVRRLCPVELSEGQFAALIDFAYNLGAGNLQASTLRRCVNRCDHEGAARQFGRWVFAGGVKLPGLVRRRAQEAAVYLAG